MDATSQRSPKTPYKARLTAVHETVGQTRRCYLCSRGAGGLRITTDRWSMPVCYICLGYHGLDKKLPIDVQPNIEQLSETDAPSLWRVPDTKPLKQEESTAPFGRPSP
jgi:hypothetical protein